MDLGRENRHWEGVIYPYEKKRFVFNELFKSVETGLITALYGLRRVGKSVLLKQLINELVAQKVSPENIFYY